ncbi:MAG: lipopolysaccharide biosynthesis protein RfbH [Lachnospiraceae bacterium]|nr:lipopolysaccharide biosynthesis protein RfbH [Lachnospiraceae bacterium]
MSAEEIKRQILELTEKYYMELYGNKIPFQNGAKINYAGRIFDEKEMVNLIDSSLEFWLTSGRYTRKFESGLAKYLGVRFCSVTNSGSSANLLAFSALTAPELGERQIKKGDEVITVAAGFPTTVAPIVQYGAIPVFVDVAIGQYNIDVQHLEEAYSEKTKAVMLAHTLGNPFDVVTVRDFCKKHGLWLIEDNCDALGSKVLIDGQWKYTGTIGDIGTSSFYPPHHMTMGEGGAVYTDNRQLYRLVNSYRDWGRDCYCQPGMDGTCQHRFEGQYGELPQGYDHKYVYSHFGYNLKITDMQAAVGCAQLEKLDSFAEKRKKNWNYLHEKLEGLSDLLVLPQALNGSDPSWFGFLITVKEKAEFTRNELVGFLEESSIQTRNLFAGNLIKHPCFDEMRKTGQGFRVVGTLEHTDYIMNQSFWIGVYPGMTERKMDYMVSKIQEFVEKNRKR